MKNMKMMIEVLSLTASIIVLNTGSLSSIILFFLCVLFCVAALPDANRRESVWLFILTAITAIPINIALMMVVERYISVLSCGVIGKISGMIVILSDGTLWEVQTALCFR